MRAAFDAIDKDSDGQLSVAEVHRAAAGGCRSCPDRWLPGVGLCEAALHACCPLPCRACHAAVLSMLPCCPAHAACPSPPAPAALGISVAPEDSQRMVELLDTDKVCSPTLGGGGCKPLPFMSFDLFLSPMKIGPLVGWR